MKCGDDEIDKFDADEGNDEAAETVDKQVALQNGQRTHWSVRDAAERQRDQGDDNQRVKDDGT